MRRHLADQAGVAAIVLAVEPAGAELLEELARQARPDVAVGIVPGVELDLHDIGDEGRGDRRRRRRILPLRRLGRLPGPLLLRFRAAGQRIDFLGQPVHKSRLARPPVAEQPDGERRVGFLQADQLGESLDVGRDVERVVGGDQAMVGVVARDGPPVSPPVPIRAEQLPPSVQVLVSVTVLVLDVSQKARPEHACVQAALGP